jgi:hypothetical protein
MVRNPVSEMMGSTKSHLFTCSGRRDCQRRKRSQRKSRLLTYGRCGVIQGTIALIVLKQIEDSTDPKATLLLLMMHRALEATPGPLRIWVTAQQGPCPQGHPIISMAACYTL